MIYLCILAGLQSYRHLAASETPISVLDAPNYCDVGIISQDLTQIECARKCIQQACDLFGHSDANCYLMRTNTGNCLTMTFIPSVTYYAMAYQSTHFCAWPIGVWTKNVMFIYCFMFMFSSPSIRVCICIKYITVSSSQPRSLDDPVYYTHGKKKVCVRIKLITYRI